jgi:WD40 repeat protein
MDLATDFGSTWLVTGSRDCTVIIWEINPSLELPIVSNPLHLLYGHDDAVNCVSVSPELDIVVSGSDDGTIIVHKLREGIYVRSISLENIPSAMSKGGTGTERLPADIGMMGSSLKSSRMVSKCRIHFVGISHEGYFLAYSNDDMALYTFTTNGEFVARKAAGERLHVFQLSEDNKVLITGGERALLVMRWVHSLELSNVGSKWEFDAVLDGSNAEEDLAPFNSPIRSMYLTKKERHLIVGLESGELRILAQVSLSSLIFDLSLLFYYVVCLLDVAGLHLFCCA